MSEGARRRRSSQGGRIALIVAAERLMALRGLSGVSLREINQVAGLKNVAAAHYHFGSRDGVVAAILEHRVPEIQARRRAYMENLKDKGEPSLRDIVGALVWPLVGEMLPRPEGAFYLRFLEQLRRERADSPLLNLGGDLTPSWGPITTQIRSHLKHLPAQVAVLRLRLELSHMVSGLASIETWIEQGELSPGDLHLAAEILIDGVVHALSAPASAETLQRQRNAGGL